MKTGIELIAEERREQIEKHGRTILKDVAYNSTPTGPFKILPIKIAVANLLGVVGGVPYPDHWDKEICIKMQSKSEIGKLATAGALIAAEIDRLLAI